MKAGESALFVWSRNNGSDVYPITAMAWSEVTVSQLGRDRQAELDIGDLVEVVDDAAVGLLGRDGEPDVVRALFKVSDVLQHPRIRMLRPYDFAINQSTWMADGVAVDFRLTGWARTLTAAPSICSPTWPYRTFHK